MLCRKSRLAAAKAEDSYKTGHNILNNDWVNWPNFCRYNMILALTVIVAFLGPSLSEACGTKPYSARVVNGDNAEPHAWPWQISLRVNGRHICGGSLIDPDWVVTAAHCVFRDPRPSTYTVVVGAHRRLGTTAHQKSFRLRKLFMHKTFNMRELKNDIALLQLEAPAKMSQQVHTVCLPPSGSKIAAGSNCYITGWGRTIGGGSAADHLQQAMLPVAEHDDCVRVNGYMGQIDKNSMVCAGGQGKGGCQGDSGGPFVCEEGGRFVLRGAVSWGHEMCRTDHYSVFARVSSFIEWINQRKSGAGGNGGGGGGGGGGSECVDRDPRCPYYPHLCARDPRFRAACRRTCRQC